MKAILEFNLPEDKEEFRRALKGGAYFDTIGCIIEYLKRTRDLQSDSARYNAYENARSRVFVLCKEHGFSPWEDE